ncbi:MAG: hypothetical protein KF851_01060 [Pirellulaceae bacterium]|nr:hypothetical protein [Pirellulaceae bacterium]
MQRSRAGGQQVVCGAGQQVATQQVGRGGHTVTTRQVVTGTRQQTRSTHR